MTWLLIETSAFYIYVMATVIFLAWHMIREMCGTQDPHSDRAKAMMDFIVYNSMNIAWFSMHFVLCCMPAICIFFLNKNEALIRQRFDGSYAPIMYIIWVSHIIVLVFKSRIIKLENMGIGQLNEADIIKSSFGKDEAFQPRQKESKPDETT